MALPPQFRPTSSLLLTKERKRAGGAVGGGAQPEGRTGWRPQMAPGAFLRQESVTAVGLSLL